MEINYVIEAIREEFESGNVRNELFPMMTKFGVRDYSETVHTLGLNDSTAIGRTIEGISAISECPVYPYGKILCESVAEATIAYGESKKEKDAEVRPDSIWYSKETNSPILISEFERYENNRIKDKKLKEKIQNLLIAYHQLGGELPLIVFVYWSYPAVTAGDISDTISILDKGFYLPNKKYVAGINSRKTKYLVYHCIAKGTKENLTLNQWIKVR